MTGVLERPGASQIVTYAPTLPPSQPRWLGEIGHIVGLNYSYACPGGCDQMACTLQISALDFPDALAPGRWIYIVRGASVIWSGKLDEPQPSAAGWQVSGHGSGTFGADFAAVYSGTWDTTPPSPTPDACVNGAIARGLNWVNPGIGNPAGIWVAQATDSGAQQIDSMLNLITSRGGLTWYVACTPAGNVLSVFPLPTTPTNLLASNTPVSRTLGGDTNVIWLRYQTQADSTAQVAAYSTTSATDAQSVAAHGPMETFADLSSAPTMSSGAAVAIGNQVLKRYQRASFAGPFTVGPGQLLTLGGAPVDLGCGMPYAPMCIRVMLTDYAYGGETTPAPVTFLAGGYAFDDDSSTATITPFQSLDTSFSGLLSMIVSTQPPRAAGT